MTLLRKYEEIRRLVSLPRNYCHVEKPAATGQSSDEV